jgi:hypothetical protein
MEDVYNALTDQEKMTDIIIHNLLLCDEVHELVCNLNGIDANLIKYAEEAQRNLIRLSFMLSKKAKELEDKTKIEDK